MGTFLMVSLAALCYLMVKAAPDIITNSETVETVTDTVAAKNTGVDRATTKKIIAICAPTRSKPDWQFVNGTALQNLLVKSLTKTVTEADRLEYDFRLYLAADHNDTFWIQNRDNIKAPDWLSVHLSLIHI